MNRAGGYYNYEMQNAGHIPEPSSSHFIHEGDRFNKDFASHDKEQRAVKFQQKQANMEKRRLENYDRDMKRWEFMDNEDTD